MDGRRGGKRIRLHRLPLYSLGEKRIEADGTSPPAFVPWKSP